MIESYIKLLISKQSLLSKEKQLLLSSKNDLVYIYDYYKDKLNEVNKKLEEEYEKQNYFYFSEKRTKEYVTNKMQKHINFFPLILPYLQVVSKGDKDVSDLGIITAYILLVASLSGYEFSNYYLFNKKEIKFIKNNDKANIIYQINKLRLIKATYEDKINSYQQRITICNEKILSKENKINEIKKLIIYLNKCITIEGYNTSLSPKLKLYEKSKEFIPC